jgi:hypothetical protein
MSAVSRRGATLLVVMIALTGIAALALGGRESAAVAIRQIMHREAEVRSQLIAEGCLVVWQARVEAALALAPSPLAADSVWSTLFVYADADPRCVLTRRPAGYAVDANTADTLLLLAALTDMAGGRGQELLDRLLDWRDLDDRPRPLGAERDAYRSAGSPGPANDWFWTDDEVLQALGDTSYAGVATRYVAVEVAPLWKQANNPFLSGHTQHGALDTTAVPRAWYLHATIRLRPDAPCITVQWRMARNGTRVTVPDRRTLIDGADGASAGRPACA